MKQSFFGGKATQFHFDDFEDDRGSLLPIYFEALDFSPVRTFLVEGKSGTTRGGHAHRQGCQLLLRVSGEIRVDLSLAGESESVLLGPDANALMLCAPIWSSQTYLGDSPRLLVFSDQPYDKSGYIDAPS